MDWKDSLRDSTNLASFLAEMKAMREELLAVMEGAATWEQFQQSKGQLYCLVNLIQLTLSSLGWDDDRIVNYINEEHYGHRRNAGPRGDGRTEGASREDGSGS